MRGFLKSFLTCVLCTFFSVSLAYCQTKNPPEIQARFGISAQAYNIIFGGFVGSAKMRDFIDEFVRASRHFSDEPTRGSKKIILVSIGNKILSDGRVDDGFIVGADEQVYEHLKQKSFESGICNIERLRTTTGQRISWVVSEVDNANEQIAQKCIAISVAIFLDLDFLEMNKLSTAQIIQEIQTQERTH